MIKPRANVSWQLIAFLLVGAAAIIVDFIGYWILKLFMPIDWAKGLGYIWGIVVVYVGNKFWTFDQPHKSKIETIKFSALYVITLSINVVANDAAIKIWPSDWDGMVYNFEYKLLAGFVVSTTVTAIINFIAQKWWVFKKVAA